MRILFLLLFLNLPAYSASESTIKTQLFGQACELSGPLEEYKLKLIHQISPAEIPHEPLGTLEYDASGKPLLMTRPLDAQEVSTRLIETKKTLEALKKTDTLPVQFEHYLITTKRRLESLLAFQDAFIAYERDGKIEAFCNQLAPHLIKNKKTFLKRLKASVKKRKIPEFIAISYQENIEQIPEDEFHSQLLALKLKYSCNYEDDTDGQGAESNRTE